MIRLLPLVLIVLANGWAVEPDTALDSVTVLAAARAADDLYQRHLEELRVKLGSGDENERIATIATIGRLQDPTLVPALLPFLEGAVRSSRELAAACHALGHLGDTASAPALRSLIQANADPEVRLAALNALEQIKATIAADYMGRAKDPELDLTGIADTNLGTLAHEPAAAILAKGLLSDPRPLIRQMCAIGLGRLGDRSNGPNLQDALGDANPGVRRYAAEALVKLNYTPSIPYLLMALEGNSAGQYLNRCLMLLSGQDFGFDYRDSELKRRNAVERGFAWWADHAAELKN
jgi:HEAT repeat protein